MQTGLTCVFPPPQTRAGVLAFTLRPAVLLEISVCSCLSTVLLDLRLIPRPSLLLSSPSYIFAAVLWGLGKERLEWWGGYPQCNLRPRVHSVLRVLQQGEGAMGHWGPVTLKPWLTLRPLCSAFQNMPNVRDHDASVYLRLQGDALSVGGYETNPIFWEEVRH